MTLGALETLAVLLAAYIAYKLARRARRLGPLTGADAVAFLVALGAAVVLAYYGLI